MNFTNFYPCWGIFAALRPIFCYFFYSWVQKYVWKDVIHTVISAFKKSNIFILREFCKRTYCPPIVTLALLLFLDLDCNTGTGEQGTLLTAVMSRELGSRWKSSEAKWSVKMQGNDMLCYKIIVVINKLYDIAICLILFCAILCLLYNEFVFNPN